MTINLKTQVNQPSLRYQRRNIPTIDSNLLQPSTTPKKSNLTKAFETSIVKKIVQGDNGIAEPPEKRSQVSSNHHKPPSGECKTRDPGVSSLLGKSPSQSSYRPKQCPEKSHHKLATASKYNIRTRANSMFTQTHGPIGVLASPSETKRLSSVPHTCTVPEPTMKPPSKLAPTKSVFTIPVTSRLTRSTRSFELKTADRRKEGSASSSRISTVSNDLPTSSQCNSVSTDSEIIPGSIGDGHSLQRRQKQWPVSLKAGCERIMLGSHGSCSSSSDSDADAPTYLFSASPLNSRTPINATSEPTEESSGGGPEEVSSSPVEIKNRVLSSSLLAAKLSSSRLSLVSAHSRLTCAISVSDVSSERCPAVGSKLDLLDDVMETKESATSSVSSTPNSRQGTPQCSLLVDTETDKIQFPTAEPQTLEPCIVLKTYSHKLSLFERNEILGYSQVYFFGQNIRKKLVKGEGTANFGYDDNKGDYHVIVHDHLAYRYEILEVLGKGSFGKVVRAMDHKTGQLVAIKVIRNSKQCHTQALVEVKILECLHRWDPDDAHSMIRMHESFYFRNHLCITFEPLDLNLYDYLKVNSFKGCDINFIREVTLQILQALCLLKSHHVLHCDLKPENILLKSAKSSQIKVIDVGSSCFESERIYTYIQSRFYRAPEVILGVPYTMAIDMWSLGCILVELYTAHPIFAGENEREQLCCIMEVLGVPPRHLIDRCARKIVFFDSNNSPRPAINSKGKRRRPGHVPLSQILAGGDKGFIDFVSRCLEWDPLKRITPEEALNHHWFQESSGCTLESPLRVPKNPKADCSQSRTRGPSHMRTSGAKPIAIRNNKVHPNLGTKSTSMHSASYLNGIDFLRQRAHQRLQT